MKTAEPAVRYSDTRKGKIDALRRKGWMPEDLRGICDRDRLDGRPWSVTPPGRINAWPIGYRTRSLAWDAILAHVAAQREVECAVMTAAQAATMLSRREKAGAK